MSLHPLETYLADCHAIRTTGANAPETSFYPALSALLNEVGRHLKPKVRCVMGMAKSLSARKADTMPSSFCNAYFRLAFSPLLPPILGRNNKLKMHLPEPVEGLPPFPGRAQEICHYHVV